MSKKRDVKLYLQDILDEIRRVENFTRDVRSFEEFSRDELVYYAVLKALENIGEAVKNYQIAQRNSMQWTGEKSQV